MGRLFSIKSITPYVEIWLFYDIIKTPYNNKKYHIELLMIITLLSYDNNFVIVSIFLYFMYNINKYSYMENIKNVWYIQIFN